MRLFRCHRKNKEVEEIAANDTPTKDRSTTSHQPAQIASADNIEQEYSPQHGTAEEQRSPPSPDRHNDLRVDDSDVQSKMIEPSQIPHSGTAAGKSASPRLIGYRPGRSAVPPPVREAAFHGPPRFDWIDIVSG
jgi:hypothetical protein